MTSQIADILERAADLIEPEGKWTQKSWGNKHTCMCAEGAIAAACHDLRVRFDVCRDAFERVLPDPDENWKSRIPAWNDAPGRTQSEVVQTLRQAAAKAREEG